MKSIVFSKKKWYIIVFFKKKTLIWTQSLLMGNTAQSFTYPLLKISNIETSVSVDPNSSLYTCTKKIQQDPTRSTGYHTQRDPSLLFIGTPQRVPPPTCTTTTPTCTTTTYPSTSATARAMALLKVAGWRVDRPNARSRTLLLLVWSFILMRLDRPENQ